MTKKQKERFLKAQNRDLTNICKHISRIMGRDKRSGRIITEIQNWRSKSGAEWSVERLKSLKRCVIEYVSNDTMQTRNEFPSTEGVWIKKTKNGWPKGPLGNFITDNLRTNRFTEKNLGVVLSILEVGKTMKRLTILQSQKDKFLEAIRGTPYRADIDEYTYEVGKTCSDVIGKKMQFVFKIKYKSNHKFSFAGLNSAKPSTTFLSKDMKQIHPWLYSFIEGTTMNGPWTPILKDIGIPVIKGSQAVYGGKISVLQEGGLKARVIAVPVAAAQVAFKPLHETLGSLLRGIKEDCTHDQSKGIKWGSEELRKGKVVHAVDLSSATDNFPLGFQLAVLDRLGYMYTEEFKQFCRMSFGFKEEGKPLTYTKGQPMGLYGSFSLFALSHHVLLKHIQKSINVVDTYRILGDDIIISNDEVHSRYLSAMSDLGVPISYHKCLNSDLFTEFAGKLISPMKGIEVAKGPTLKDGMINIDQFINYCKVTGTYKNAIKGVPKKFREFAKRVVALPEQFGGLGINPEGYSVDERLVSFEKSRDRSFPLSEDLSSSLSFTMLLSNGNRSVGLVCNYINEKLTVLNQRLDSDLKQEGFLFKDSKLKRAVLAQLVDSQERDNPLSYIGTLRTYRSKSSIYADWKTVLQSTNGSIERRLDKMSNHDIDSLSNDYGQPDVSGLTSRDIYPTM